MFNKVSIKIQTLLFHPMGSLKEICFLVLMTQFINEAVAQTPDIVGPSPLLYAFRSLEDSAINQSHPTSLGINEGWNLYKDIIFPGTRIKGSLSKNRKMLPGITLLNCSITGGDEYNNIFFTYTLAKKWMGHKWAFASVDAFEYSLDFFVQNKIDCSSPNGSELEGLEFTFQQTMPPFTFLWGLQWSKSSVWSYWDQKTLNGRTRGWVPIPQLHACMLYKQWNHIRITGHRNETGLFYDTLILNENTFAINTFVPKASVPRHWTENYLQVGFQINGNKAIRNNHPHGVDPVTVLLNNVDLFVKSRE
jgi:hypothetical protein